MPDSRSYILYPPKELATKIINGENWIKHDEDKFLEFESSNDSGIQYSYTPIEGVTGIASSSNQQTRFSWIELKINLDTLSDTSYIDLGSARGRDYSQNASIVGARVTKATFAAVGLTSGIVTLSLQTFKNGYYMGSWSTFLLGYSLFINGYRVERNIFVPSTHPRYPNGLSRNTYYPYTFSFVRVSAGVEIASVVRRIETQKDVIRRWWYVKNLELSSQVSGQDEVAVTPTEANNGYTHNESNTVEMSTLFTPREGSTYTSVFTKAYARHVRNSVQFGRAKVRATIGGVPVRTSGINHRDAEPEPTMRLPLTLLDVGVETYTEVSGSLKNPTNEELMKLGMIVELDHDNYSGI